MAVPASSPLGVLPIPRTRLVGREAEIAAGRDFLLQEAVPLLTLTGPGGVGKTRLALAIAAEVAPAFADGAIFVDLSLLADEGLVAASAAAALGVSTTPDSPIIDAILAQLRAEQRLLVLDNCEHVLVAAAELASSLLAGCPALQVLATSRAPLRVRGEQILGIPPLAVPEMGVTELARVQEASAVRLFVQRARAASAPFALTEENVSAVAAICQRLDGLPLALELAAARVNVLSAQTLLVLLSQRLQLLTGGPRDAPERQQTMRSAIAWSYDLLSCEEKAFLHALSVFVGGWTLEAAAAVSGLPVSDALARLDGLVQQSLVTRQDGADDKSPRFTMLETIHEFALDQPIESRDDVIHERHADFFLALAEQAASALPGRGQVAWLERLERDHSNLRAALEFVLSRGDTTRAARLASSLCDFWRYRTQLREGLTWLERVLAAGNMEPRLRILVLHGYVDLANALDQRQRAMPRAEEALALARDLGNTLLEGHGLLRVGLVLRQEDGENDRAEPYFLQALDIYRTYEDWEGQAFILTRLGETAGDRGDLTVARARYEEAFSLYQQSGAESSIAASLHYLARITAWTGDGDRALPLAEEAVRRFRLVGDRSFLMEGLTQVGWLLANHLGDDAAASVAFEEALDISQTFESAWANWEKANALHHLGAIATRRGNDEEAIARHEAERNAWREAGEVAGVAWATIGLGEVARLRGDSERAAAYFRGSLATLHEFDFARGDPSRARQTWAAAFVAPALHGLSIVLARQDLPLAARLAGAAAAMRAITGHQSLMGHPSFHAERLRLERDLASLKSALGVTAFAAAFAAGGSLTTDEAVVAALAVPIAKPQLLGRSEVLVPMERSSRTEAYGLTLRERQILTLLCQRLTDSEIAAQLFISLRTVNNHVANIFAKLDVHTRREATALATRHGLV